MRASRRKVDGATGYIFPVRGALCFYATAGSSAILRIATPPIESMHLMYPETQQFDAHLPRLERAVRITGLYDAQVFTRRWTIRDKDPALKALLRRLDSANSAETAARALLDFKSALDTRGLLA
jgi:hypothetical protein